MAAKSKVTPKETAEIRRLCAKIKDSGRVKKRRLGGPYVSDAMGDAFAAYSKQIGIAQTDIIEGLLSKLLRIN